jgi:signal transduction histidine kinase
MRDDILSAVSHELRTPLAAIVGFAATLEQRSDDLDDATRKRIHETLAQQARKLERLLLDLLDADRLRRGMLEAHRHKVDLTTLVRTSAEDCELGTCTLELDLHQVDGEVDAAKIERIVENLVANAVKYGPERGEITVRLERRGKAALLAVEDRGPGIVVDDKQAIFEMFRRGSGNTRIPGTGIGLSLVSRFAELHGGRAWVEDRHGGGSSFRVLVPL